MPVPGRANPYQPGRGVFPPVMAGRAREMGLVERRFEELARGRTCSQDILFYGPRGHGKTTLLIETERRAGDLGLRTEDFPVDSLTDSERLVRALQERAGVLGGGATGLQIAGLGATTERVAPSRDVSSLFSAWLALDPRPLVLLLDEIHSLEPAAARPFFEAVQTAKRGPTPFLLVTAGTPDAPWRLRRAGTFNERGFEDVRVGRLRRADTVRALAEPAERGGRPMSEEAAQLLAVESQDYPYFIQLIGSAAWHAAEETSEIGIDAVRRGIAAMRPRINHFYGARLREAWDAGIAPALPHLSRLFVKHGGAIGFQEFLDLIERLAADDAIELDRVALLRRLEHLGVVWQASPGRWEMGIPSFANFVLSRENRASAYGPSRTQ